MTTTGEQVIQGQVSTLMDSDLNIVNVQETSYYVYIL